MGIGGFPGGGSGMVGGPGGPGGTHGATKAGCPSFPGGKDGRPGGFAPPSGANGSMRPPGFSGGTMPAFGGAGPGGGLPKIPKRCLPAGMAQPGRWSSWSVASTRARPDLTRVAVSHVTTVGHTGRPGHLVGW